MKRLFTLLFSLIVSCASAQTSVQGFGTGTGTYNTSNGTSTTFLPNPTTSGTTYIRISNGQGGSVNLNNPGLSSLGTTTEMKAVASTGTNVVKATPVYQYTNSKVFYTQFYTLLGDNSGGNTATTGNWAFYQGANNSSSTFNNASDFNTGDVFVALRWTYGASGALTLAYHDAGAWNGISGCWNQGVVYKVELIGNNQSSGTINYSYGSTNETVPINTYDLWINGNLISDDLNKDALANNININSITFIGQSSTSNVATIFVDDISIYNSVPSSITSGCTTPTTNSSSLSFSGTTTTSTTLNWTNGDGNNRIVVVKQNAVVSGNPTDGTTYTANTTFGSGSTIATNEYVVYNGCSNSVTVTGLTPGYGYNFKVYEYNCNSGNEMYLTSSAPNSSVVITPNSPTAFATDCGTNGDIALTWTLPSSGYYDNIIIFARQGSAPSHTPSGNGNTTYTGANGNFSSAPTFGTDKLVYSGTGTSTTITGLTAGQTYYFRAYAYSATGYSAVTSTISQVSGVADVTGVSVTSAVDKLTVNWTNPTSCYDEVLIIATDNASVSSVPTGDGSSYSTAQFYHDDATEINAPSNEFIVYKGTAVTSTIYGLINGTTYHIKIFVRKGTYWSLGYSTSGVPNYANGDWRTRPTGITWPANWSSNIWQQYSGSTWSNVSGYPSSNTASVWIQNGATVVLNSTANNAQMATLTVETGGKLYCNQSTTQYFLSVYTQVICNGTIGNGSTNDALALNMEGNPCFIGGTGTCYLAAIRKSSTSVNVTTNLFIDMDVHLNIVGSNKTVMYDNQNNSTFNVTINAGNTVSTPNNTGHISMDGTSGSGGGTRTGTYTVYGTLNVNGILYMTCGNGASANPYNIDIKNGGKIYVDSINASGSGAGDFILTIENGGWLDIYGKAFYTFSTTNNTFTCNTGSLVEYCGAVAQTVESGIVYDNLKFSGGAYNKTPNADLYVNGDLTVDAAIFETSTNNIVLYTSGDITLQNSGTMSNNCKTYLDITTNSTSSSQTFTGNSQLIKCYNFTSAKSSGGLTFTGSSGNTDLVALNDFEIDYTGSALITDNGNTITVGDDLHLGSGSSTASNFAFTGTFLFNFQGTANGDYHISNVAQTGITVAKLNNLSLISVVGGTGATVVVYPTGGGQTLYIKGNLIISNSNSVNTVLNPSNNTIDIKGNWTDYSNAGFTEGTGLVVFTGTSNQTITGAETFYKFQMNGSGGATLANTVIVSNTLTLTNGLITTSTNELQVTNTAVASVASYSTASYVNGNLRRSLLTSNNNVYDLPVGNSSYYELATIKFTNTTGLGASPTLLAFFTSGLPSTMPNNTACRVNGNGMGGMLNAGYWTVTPSAFTTGTTTYEITLVERGYSNFSGNANQMGVIKRHDNTYAWTGCGGSNSANEGTHSNATQSIASGVATAKRTAVKTFSEYGIGYSANPLPVELTTFTAKAVDNKSVNLFWNTQAELFCSYYSVERSADGINFSEIGKVMGHGTSQISHDYNFIDNAPLCGTAYYRLMQVDEDGEFHYTPVASAVINCSGNFSIYPNPTMDYLNIDFSSSVNAQTIVKVIGSDGKIYIQNVAASSQMKLDVSHLPSGFYFVNIETGSNNAKYSFIKE